jgi:Zn-dependent protease/predicted transcriptional regulator
MFRSIRIGSLAGIDIFVHWTFLLLLGFFLLGGLAAGQGLAAAVVGVGFVVTLFGCVVLHELGHALAARRYGIPTRDITLLPIGGVARLERIPEKPSEELVVALAGPAVNVVIASVLAAVLWPFGGLEGIVAGETLVHNLLRVNLLLVAFNLLPAFPMDGGRVLRSLLAMRMPYVRATDVAARVGQVMAVLFGLVGLFVIGNPFLALVGVFVFFGAGAEAYQARQRAFVRAEPVAESGNASGERVSDFMVHRFRVVPPYQRIDAVADELLRTSQRGFPVVDGGRLVGMLRRRDIVTALEADAMLRAGDVMRTDIVTAEPTDNVRSALRKLLDSDHDTLAVLVDSRLVGLLQIREALPSEPAPGASRGPSSREDTVEIG